MVAYVVELRLYVFWPADGSFPVLPRILEQPEVEKPAPRERNRPNIFRYCSFVQVLVEPAFQECDGPQAMVNTTAFRLAHIGFIFQKSNLIPFLSARENVQVALELAGWGSAPARRRALELLDYLGVADRADNMPAGLSGGQQQRVAVARALANQPGIILADEPTAALDRSRGRQVMELFAKVAHEQNAGVIVVTHDERTLEVFDTTYEMEDGLIRPAAAHLRHTVITDAEPSKM